MVVYAIELFELPNEMPMAVRSPSVVPFVEASSALILADGGNLGGIGRVALLQCCKQLSHTEFRHFF